MYISVALLTLLSSLPHEIKTFRTCKPNTQFLINGRLCFCDNFGRWSDVNCMTVGRRQTCQPGQIIWQGCNQCICQENGYLLCSNSHCSDDTIAAPIHHTLSNFGRRCMPFRSYYTNCSICVCPASGIAQEAQCVIDATCTLQFNQIDLSTALKTKCIPGVMYLFSCLQCLCSERGYFVAENCLQKCNQTTSVADSTRCVSGTLYRIGCNICRCPQNSMPDATLCVSTTCDQEIKTPYLRTLRTGPTSCVPHSFTSPKCMYCDCTSEGYINENACLELDCSKTSDFKYLLARETCSPGEMVPICTECFCLRNGQTNSKYCSRACSFQNRINILEMVLKDSRLGLSLMEQTQLKKIKSTERCNPNSVYLDNNRYCLCPENGDTNFKFCTADGIQSDKASTFASNRIEIDFNAPCAPNTLVTFDCNTCYCSKKGTIDPKWCTYDDCEAKEIVQESHKMHNPVVSAAAPTSCVPGSIRKLKCNFCICPDSGILKEEACTKNVCSDFDHSVHDDKLTCEPLAYYEVGCNICYCPRDGLKNVAKCTKNPCEKSFLRSDSCIPGQLFSEACNVCVCPLDGNKMDKVCTSHECPRQVISWGLYKSSQSLPGNDDAVDQTRSLDQCFPGEEFSEGCNLCTCPETGLKMYATCESILCGEETTSNAVSARSISHNPSKLSGFGKSLLRTRRAVDNCFSYNVTTSAERKECTPGTMYIIRCKQCICPYLGNINNFCRPLPKSIYCEQAFPYFNYVPMSRRIKANATDSNHTTTTKNNPNISTVIKPKKVKEIKVQHEHTKHRCEKPGTVLDKCFICECEEGNILIEEHCFRSNATDCSDVKPSFLFENKVIVK